MALDGPGEQEPGPADLGPVAQPPAAILPAGQPSRSRRRAATAACLQGIGREVRHAGAAAAAEAQHAVADAPEGHAGLPGRDSAFTRTDPSGSTRALCPSSTALNFRGQAVEAVPLIAIEHFFHGSSIGEGCDGSHNSEDENLVVVDGAARFSPGEYQPPATR